MFETYLLWNGWIDLNNLFFLLTLSWSGEGFFGKKNWIRDQVSPENRENFI